MRPWRMRCRLRVDPHEDAAEAAEGEGVGSLHGWRLSCRGARRPGSDRRRPYTTTLRRSLSTRLAGCRGSGPPRSPDGVGCYHGVLEEP